MFNSYKLLFGEPLKSIETIKGIDYESYEDFICEFFCCESTGLMKPTKVPKLFPRMLELAQEYKVLPFLHLKKVKATILDDCYHYANENFYEIYSEYVRFERQDDFLEGVITILNMVPKPKRKKKA